MTPIGKIGAGAMAEPADRVANVSSARRLLRRLVRRHSVWAIGTRWSTCGYPRFRYQALTQTDLWPWCTCEKLGMHTCEGRDTLAFFYCAQRLVLWTKVPHGRGELKGRLPHYIRQQLRLNE